MKVGDIFRKKEELEAYLSTLRRLHREFGFHSKVVPVLVVLATVSNVLLIIAPSLLSVFSDSLYDSVVNALPVDVDTLSRIGIILIAMYVISAFLKYLQTRFMWVVEQKAGEAIRRRMSAKVSRISVGDMDKMRSGDIISRFVNDIDIIRWCTLDCIVEINGSIVMIVGAFLMMFILSWQMALVLAAPVFLGYFFIRVIVRVSQKYYRIQSRNMGELTNIVEETVSGRELVTAFGATVDAKKTFRKANGVQYHASLRARLFSNLLPQITGLVNNAVYVIVCIVGALLVMDGQVTFGVVISFLVYVKLLYDPLLTFSSLLAFSQNVVAASERVFEFMDTPEMEEEPVTVPVPEHVRGDVEFRDVSFSYVEGKEIIHGFNLSVSAGQKVAIVGPTGAGKTTLSNLLLRFYEPDSGSILIDGIPISKMSRRDVRSMFGAVLQDPWIFKGTIRENIVFGDDTYSDDDVMEAVEAVGMTAFVNSLPDGIDTFIHHPSALSNGQRQLLTIARAIVREAPIMILDEATSSVDVVAENRIQEALGRMMKGRTSFVIAHRLSTILDADLILVVRDGNVVERGTHSELMAAGGFYRSLYESQFRT